MLIDRGFYGSHIKKLLGGIKGVGVSSGRMRSFFLSFFLSFFFLFCGGGGGGGENVQEFTLRLLEVEISFSWINFWLKSEVGIIGPRTLRDGLWPFFFSFL